MEDKLAKLASLIETRNQFVVQSERADPESGRRKLQNWVQRHKLQGFVQLRLQDRLLTVQIDEPAKSDALLLAGCYVIETDVSPAAMPAQTVHDRYKDLAAVERDFRSVKTGFLEIRPVYVRKADWTSSTTATPHQHSP